jgi:hypothetical protein
MTKHLVALGDSHLEALEFAADLNLLNVGSRHFSIVPGATAVGLRNPNSLTNAIHIFKEALLSQPKHAYVVVHLGEVDCGFVMWWRAQKNGESVEEQFRQSLAAYRQFLVQVRDMGFTRLCVTGASLPTIGDDVNMGEVANKRSEISVSLQDRTDLTSRYNRALAEIAAELDLRYFDVAEATLDRSSGLVHDFFKNSDPTDHHLDKSKMAGIWALSCNAFVAGCS